MEHEDSKSVNEQSHMDMTIKTEVKAAATSSAHIDIEMDFNHLKQEPGLLRPMKSEPALLVKEEILEDGSQDNNEQQCGKGTLMSSDAGSGNAACGTNVDVLLPSKQELEDIDIEPTVLQHMDIHYTMNQNMSAVIGENAIVDDCNEAMPDSGVKKEISKNKLIGSITPQKVILNERCSTLQNPQLAVHKDRLESISRVHLMRLDTFECELCNAAYTEKRWLLQHLKSVHGSSLQTSLFIKSRKANKHQSAAAKYMPSLVVEAKMEDEDYEVMEKIEFLEDDFDYLSESEETKPEPNSKVVKRKRNKTPTKKVPSNQRTVQTSSRRNLPYKLDANDLTCPVCKETFPVLRTLKIHMNVHYPNFLCKVCERGFVTKERLRRHSISHDVGKYPCKVCNETFRNKNILGYHIKVHKSNNMAFRCPECKERFINYYMRQKHLMSVHGRDRRLYKCKLCPKSFILSGKLLNHTRSVHLQEKNYICQECGAAFYTNICLVRHMVKHTGTKDFKCAVCETEFGRKSTLREHMRIHNNDRRFSCTICEKAFIQKCTLKGHMKMHNKKTP